MQKLLKQFLVLFVILCVSFTGKTETQETKYGLFPCGYDYDVNAGWFKMHEEAATWWAANQICLSEGAELASPSNDDLKDAIMFLLYRDEYINNEVLGEGISTVHTALQLTDSMRNDPEFQDFQEDEALALNDRGQIKRVRQNLMLPFVCYKNASQDLNLHECGTTDSAYTRYSTTNKCYKFHSSRENWYSAAVICLIEGGQLAIINSPQEAEIIKQIFEKNPAETIPGYEWKDSAFLGYFADVKSNLTWLTVEEQSLSAAGYEGWSPGEPNNASGNEYCVSVGRNGNLFDDPCFRQLPFICEKRTDNCVHRNYYMLLQFMDTNIFSKKNFYGFQ